MLPAFALWSKDKCEVWCPTQNGEAALKAAVDAAAPAVLNAIFAATGKRIRRVPLKDMDLSAA